jgi:hypothetical protein
MDPDPDLDPGGPKIYGSGSPTLLVSMATSCFAAHHFRAPLVFFLPANAGQFLSLSLGHPDNPGRKQAKKIEKTGEQRGHDTMYKM